ncbi:MAG: LPXTG cell wall anchor domain-containing protein [Clostridiales bacterium]|nr:LPXTG cell wall anchor domain-containing protein [Clostridiales bacterium]MDD7431960.1 LPXTG cell wall anchor domain-containing protein [Clostridiales bacterium]MDY3060945.1 LPXTG cell wall anchor domain-containing protein [Eubacteriales bacterium]
MSKNLSLQTIAFYNNLITSIDLKKNADLEELYCSDNQLTTLDLRNNSKLKTLYTENNHISSLDLSSNPSLNAFTARDQTYSIEVDEDTLEFDLSSLPGNFDPAMATDWKGADVIPGSTILKLDSSRPTAVTYRYYSNFNKESWYALDDWYAPDELNSLFNVTLYVKYVSKNILIPYPYGAVICPTQPLQTIPLTPIPVQQKELDDIQGQVAQLPKTGEQESRAVAISSLLLLSLGAFFMISRRK